MPSVAQIDEGLPVLTGFGIPLKKSSDNERFSNGFVKNNNNNNTKRHMNGVSVDNIKNSEKNGNHIRNGYTNGNGYLNGNAHLNGGEVRKILQYISVVILFTTFEKWRC